MNLSRSKRRGFAEKYIYELIGLHPMRCLDCKVRFFLFFGLHRIIHGK
jgi:hypothetical protein